MNVVAIVFIAIGVSMAVMALMQPEKTVERQKVAPKVKPPIRVPGRPFAFLKDHPDYHNRTKKRRRKRSLGRIRSIVLHDREGRYTPSLAPYHIEVTRDGKIMHHYRANQIAPHAFRYNRYSIGVAYGGYSGEIPSKEALRALEYIVTGLRRYNPRWRIESHGEAFARTKNTKFRASKHGRSLLEAAWREKLRIVGYRPAIAVPGRLLVARRKNLRNKLRTIGRASHLERPMCVEPDDRHD
jgi:hypothetical protein